MILSDDLKSRFKVLVADRSGLYFMDHDMRNLEEAILDRMKILEIPAAPSYYSLLMSSPQKEEEFRELVNLLTINHTYFFRNEPHFRVLRNKILPEIISRKRACAKVGEKPQLRIWSAGCSTGEEPFSIAMTICDIIGDVNEWDIQIFATDAAKDALAKARSAAYRPHSMKFVEEDHCRRYFSELYEESSGVQYVLCDEIKRMVQFSFLNLMDDEFPKGFDLVFCRNVMMYFEADTMMNVANRFHLSLNDDGYFFIGYAESLQCLRDKFEMFFQDDAIYYRKQKEDEGLLNSEVFRPQQGQVDFEKDADGALYQESFQEAVSLPERQGLREEDLSEIINEAQKKIYFKDYESALSIVDSGIVRNVGSVDLRYLKAEIFSNQGNTEDAEIQLRQCLQIDPMFAN